MSSSEPGQNGGISGSEGRAPDISPGGARWKAGPVRRRWRKFMASVFARSPWLGLTLAEQAGLWLPGDSAQAGDLAPSPGELMELVGPLAGRSIKEVLRRSEINRRRGRLAAYCTNRQGLASAAPLVDWRGEDRLLELYRQGRGLILVTWHAGPLFGLWAGLTKLPVRVFKIQDWPARHGPPGWTIHVRSQKPGAGTPILAESRRRLRRGECVGLAFESFMHSTAIRKLECLGREMPFDRGMGVLAAMTDAPVVPISARWAPKGMRIIVEAEEPLQIPPATGRPAEEIEDAYVAEAVRRMERYLLAYPDEISRKRVTQMLRYPRVDLSQRSHSLRPA